MRALWLLALIALFVGCGPGSIAPVELAPAQSACVVRRAAFDVGSGTTKFKVAEIDVCTHTLLSVLDSDEAPVFYGDDVSRGDSPVFEEETMRRGVDVLRRFKARAASHQPGAYAAVATAAFRRAKNASDFVQRIRRELGIPITLISQAQEARLGFLGAVLSAGVDPERAVVWDVGGRSMQLTMLGPDGNLVIYKGELASGQMRDHIASFIQKRQAGSPNPVSHDDLHAAIAFAMEYATEHVPDALVDKLDRDDTVVVGIGALKYYGDKPAGERGAICTATLLETKVSEMLDKTDAQIGGDYAATQVSDRALLIGFMWALGVDVVQLADIDLTDGLLVESDYWVLH